MSRHRLEDVEKVCDRVGIIDRGRLLVDSTISELQARFAEPVFTIELEPGQDHDDTLSAALRELTLVTSVGRDGPVLRVTVADAASARPVLTSVLAPTGSNVARFERIRPTL